MIAALFTTAFLAQIVRIAVPYVFAALGGSLTERSGVIDLALEAKLLFGAFTAAALGHATGSAAVGVIGGMAAGSLTALAQLGCALWLEADQVIVGVALNLLALGGTRFLLQVIYHEGANSPPAPAFGDGVTSNPLVLGAVVAAILVPLAVKHTRWGLRLRAAGDRPDALVAVGVSPRRTRLYAALVGGALAGAGGAQLSLAVGGFSADMSSGRGYIALAMIILSGWRPAIAALACVGVAVAEALNILIQITHATVAGHRIPSELAPLLPYVLTIVVLAIFNGRSRQPPASLGKL
jgi:simple sugar transport system permease protein